MKKISKRSIVLIAILMVGLAHTVQAQSIYKINDSKDNDMKLSGTSSMHDWDMKAQTFTGEAQFDVAPGSDHQLTALNSLTFSLPVQNLKSDKKGLDKNAYEALKTDKYKKISYNLLSATVSPEKDSKYLIKTQGNLSIAGVTKEVAMDVYCVVNKDETITCTGSDQLKMTDYQVKPPSFMFGSMKTGDALNLNFTLVYKK